MIALVGFLMIILIVLLLLKGKMSPIVVLALIPTLRCAVLHPFALAFYSAKDFYH